MPLHVAAVVPDDFKQISAFCYKAFAMGGDVYKTAIFNPLGDTPAGEEFANQWLLNDLARNDPQDHYIKCVDDTTGEIVACACWAFYDKNPFEGNSNKKFEATWLEGYDKQKEYAEELMDTVTAARRAMKELNRPHLYVKLLVGDPMHHRRGGGTMLLKWGTRQADERGVPCAVEASTFAQQYKVYSRQGWREVKHQAFNEDQKWPDLGVAKVCLMYRPAAGEEWLGPEQ